MDEYLDVVDENNHLTGQTKPKSEVHRDGDWHRPNAFASAPSTITIFISSIWLKREHITYKNRKLFVVS